MNGDPIRAARPNAGGERHTVSVTRMCLRSGSVQLPFALSGRLPQGELLVHEADAGEPMVLWSEPPRTLAGLGPMFERHEIQVNDQLVLELQGDHLRLSVRKRPRRSRPQVTPSTWSSHRASDDPLPEEGVSVPAREGGTGTPRGHLEQDPGDGVQVPHVPGDHGDEDRAGEDDALAENDRLPFDDFGLPREGSGGYRGPTDEGEDFDDAPRAPRVRVSPLPRNEATVARRPGGAGGGPKGEGSRHPGRRDRRGGARTGSGGGVLGDAWRAAKGWFTRSDDAPRGAGGAAADEREPDWVHAWDTDPDSPGAPGADTTARTEARYGSDRSAPARDAASADERSWDEPGPWDATSAWDDPEGGEGARAPARRSVRAFPDESDPPDDDAAWLANDDEHDGASGTSPAGRPQRPEESAGGAVRDDDRVYGAAPDYAEAEGRFATDEDEDEDEEPHDEGIGDAGTGHEVGFEAPEDDDVVPSDEGEEAIAAHRRLRDPGPADPSSDDAFADDEASERAAVRRAAAWRPESGVPSRAERFLAGDLRTRLLRFLTSPDMPLIAKTELIASRFDLPSEVARDMLEDIADDPPRGFRLTPVREGAWRIERTGT